MSEVDGTRAEVVSTYEKFKTIAADPSYSMGIKQSMTNHGQFVNKDTYTPKFKARRLGGVM